MSNKGSALVIILAVLAVIFAGATGYFYLQSQKNTTSPVPITTPQATLPVAKPADETANWKIFSGKYFTFKYPNELKLVDQGLESQAKEIFVTYVREGFNRINSDLSDGYVFSISWGLLVDAGSLEKTTTKVQADSKSCGLNPTTTVPILTTLSGQKAITFDAKNCTESKYIITSDGKNTYVVRLTNVGSENLQSEYKKSLDQILSTFRFTN